MTRFFRKTNIAEREINFDSFTKFSLFIVRFVFIDFQPLCENASFRTKFIYKAKTYLTTICLLSCAIAILQVILYAAVNAKDFVDATRRLEDAMSTFLTFLKASVTYSRRHEIWEILEEFKSFFILRKEGNQKYEIKSYHRIYRRILKWFVLIAVQFVPHFAFVLISYVIFGTKTAEGNFFHFWYPFDPYDDSNYLYAILWTDWVVYVTLMFFLTADPLFYCFITMLTMEFDILAIDLSNLKDESEDARKEKIKRLIQQHHRLMVLSDKLQNVYSPNFLGVFLVSSIVMCLCTFHLLNSENVDVYLYNAGYLTSIFCENILLCWFGQKLIDSSLGVAKGIYESDWTEVRDIDYKKQIPLIILRAQKPKHLTAMGFAIVSLEGFTTVRLN